MDKKTDYSANEVLKKLYSIKKGPSIDPQWTEDQFKTWQEKKKEEVKRLLCLSQLNEYLSEPVSAQKEEEFTTDGIRISKYAMKGISGLTTPVYIVKEKGRKKGTILYLHGHDRFGVQGALKHLEENSYHKNLPILLAKAGYRVYAPEMLGFGEARKTGFNMASSVEGSCYPAGTQLLACGFSLAGFRTLQSQKTLDFMNQRGETEIGIFGISGGGMGAMYLGAVDNRAAFMIVSGYACTWKYSLFLRHHCIDNFVPGMLHAGDCPELLALYAPKKLLLLNGIEDQVFLKDGARVAQDTVRLAYKILNASHQYTGIMFDGGHEIPPAQVLDWLQ